MKNKKGIAIIKTILFITILTLFSILVIYVIKYINDKNKQPNKENIKMITPTEYNPVNDISTYNIYSYKNNNFVANTSYTTNIFNYETNNLVYYYAMSPEGDRIYNNASGYYPIGLDTTKNNNKILIGRDLYKAHQISYENRNWNNNGDVRSWSIGYNCNIPIESFNFTIYYNYPINATITPYLYIYTDVGSVKITNITFNATTLNNTFSYTQILSTLPNATKVLRFGFAFASGSNYNYTYYLPSYANITSLNNVNYDSNQVYRSYFNTLTDTQKDNCCYISFATTTYPIDYTEGYNNGYNDAINYTNGQINQLNNTIITLQNNINELSNTISNQNITIQSLQNQLNNANTNFKGFFFTLADTPIRTISNCLGFEVFGVNLFQFFIGVLTALGCIWLIKKFL